MRLDSPPPLHDATAEAPFSDSIDHRFPYSDHQAASALIDKGWSISLNAAFGVLEEICRTPFPSPVSPQRQHELIAEWAQGFEHHLKTPVLRCAEALVDDQPLPWPDAVAIMEQIGEFDGQRAALNIAYFAGDCESEEGDQALTSANERIRENWAAKGV